MDSAREALFCLAGGLVPDDEFIRVIEEATEGRFVARHVEKGESSAVVLMEIGLAVTGNPQQSGEDLAGLARLRFDAGQYHFWMIRRERVSQCVAVSPSLS